MNAGIEDRVANFKNMIVQPREVVCVCVHVNLWLFKFSCCLHFTPSSCHLTLAKINMLSVSTFNCTPIKELISLTPSFSLSLSPSVYFSFYLSLNLFNFCSRLTVFPFSTFFYYYYFIFIPIVAIFSICFMFSPGCFLSIFFYILPFPFSSP